MGGYAQDSNSITSKSALPVAHVRVGKPVPTFPGHALRSWLPHTRHAVASGQASPVKLHCFDYLNRNAGAIAVLGDSIFHFAELGMQEFETAKLMTGLLEAAGFAVERGISGFPTGFCARFGSGHPVIAIHTEY